MELNVHDILKIEQKKSYRLKGSKTYTSDLIITFKDKDQDQKVVIGLFSKDKNALKVVQNKAL